jgi:opacity protein-like surface antigen
MKTLLHRTIVTVVLLIAADLFTAPSLRAQDQAGVRFGLKLSPNLSMLSSETKGIKASGNKFGYTFGLMAEFPIGSSGNYQFATGLNLNNVGGVTNEKFEYKQAIEGPLLTRELETTYKLQYIELPLTVRLMTNEIGYMRYFAQVGFGASFNIRAKADRVVPEYFEPPANAFVKNFIEEQNENIQDRINLFRAALIVGAGAEYNFSGNTSLLFGITYNNGFTNIANFDVAVDKKARLLNNYLELTLGLYF